MVAHYLVALATVMASYFLYVKFLVPVIEGDTPPTVVATTSNNRQLGLPKIDKRILIPLLPPDAWELNEGKVIVTQSGTILFQNLERLENGTLQVVPFTMVSGVGESQLTGQTTSNLSERTPVVLRCLSGANLKFDRPLKDTFDKEAKLTLARLTGDVDIYRPPTKEDRSDMLHLLTRNVQVDHNRIYTLERVAFSLGNHRGRGRNLMIDLKHDQQIASARDFSSINGVSRLELAFLEQLRIEPKPSSNELSKPEPFESSNDGAKSAQRQVFHGNSPVEVRCEGPFVMDLDGNSISFRDNVLATQLDEHRNQISCDQLLIDLKKKTEQPKPAELKSPDLTRDPDFNSLDVERFVAVGSPAKVIANSIPARFSADELSFDVSTNTVSGISRSERSVTLLTTQEQVVSKQLAYTFEEADSEMGNIQSSGPGRLLKLTDDKTRELFVTWEKTLATRSDKNEPGKKTIILSGKTTLKASDQLNIQANSLELTLEQLSGTAKKSKFRPIKATARGDVQFQSEQLTGTTQELNASWQNVPFTSQAIRHRAGKIPITARQLSPGLIQAAGQIQDGRPDRLSSLAGSQLVEDDRTNPKPEAGIAQEIRLPGADRKNKPNAKSKIHCQGRRVDVVLIPTNNDKTDFSDLIVSGNVILSQHEILPNGKTAPTLDMTGESLRLVPQGPPGPEPGNTNRRPFKAVLTSKIQPATIKTPEAELQGNRISVDQLSDRIWVTGEGSIKFHPSKKELPRDSVSPFPKPSPTASASNDRQLADFEIRWLGGMIFDGQSIYFERKVRLTATDIDKKFRNESLGLAEAIKVRLNRTIDLQTANQSDRVAEDVKPIEWILVDWVSEDERAFAIPANTPEHPLSNRPPELYFKSSTYQKETGQQMSQQVIQASRATIRAEEKMVTAEGPGRIAMHRRNPPRKKTSSRSTANPMSRLASQGKQHPLTFVQINFDGTLRVDGTDNNVEVKERIRTAYVDVDHWDQGIDPDQAQRQSAAGVVLLTCDQLNLARWQPRNSDKPTHELLASGNVRVDGEQLECQSERLSYDQSTDSLVIEGTPLSDAKIWYRRKNDTTVNQANVQKGTFRISDQSFEAIVKSAVIQK